MWWIFMALLLVGAEARKHSDDEDDEEEDLDEIKANEAYIKIPLLEYEVHDKRVLMDALKSLSSNTEHIKVIKIESSVGLTLLTTNYRALYIDENDRVCEMYWRQSYLLGLRIINRNCKKKKSYYKIRPKKPKKVKKPEQPGTKKNSRELKDQSESLEMPF
ncbi:hypothetical protein GE061_012569 [Apolygus lucorum]|uniref:Uncharacterized protein n=1 Tax=Apolygus lucorum TaxID=248454 RepID=A0A8S9XUR4_APOLU|nr:hypothetical protein GE061_012569 [Apolygus lucorum]